MCSYILRGLKHWAMIVLILVAERRLEQTPSAPVGRWAIHASGGSFVGIQPSFSPDGSSIVYSSPATGHGDLYRFDRRTGKNVRLSVDPEYEGYPLFSPEGNVLFMRETNKIGHLWVMEADGRNQRRLTDGQTEDVVPSFSKDGKSIAFCRIRAGVSHVWIMDNNSGKQKQLTDGPWLDWAPKFSPDGTLIVFERKEPRRPRFARDAEPATLRESEIFAMNADGRRDAQADAQSKP